MRTSLLTSLTVVCTLLVVVASSAKATVYTYYDKDFNASNGAGVRGPVPPNSPTFTNSSFGVDASAATLRNQSDFAFVNQSAFQFRDLGGVSGGTPGSGSATFTSKTVSFFVGTAPFSYLNATFNAAVSSLPGNGESYVVNAIVNGVATGDTINVTSNGFYSMDISDDVNVGPNNTFAFQVVATQNTNSTWSLDNLLMRGAASPEPASMSLIGMGVLTMCGAGYCRRKRKHAVAAV